MIKWFKQSLRIEPIRRSAYGFCRGLRGAVSTSSMPIDVIAQTDVVAVDAIPIANEIPRGIPIGEGLDQLLRRPGCGGMLGHIEMQHLTTTMLQHDEYKQHSHAGRGHGEKINRCDLADVVVQKRLPGLSRRSAECAENSGHRAFGDPYAEHLQFSVKPGSTQQRIGRHHALDEPAYLHGCGSSAASA